MIDKIIVWHKMKLAGGSSIFNKGKICNWEAAGVRQLNKEKIVTGRIKPVFFVKLFPFL